MQDEQCTQQLNMHTWAHCSIVTRKAQSRDGDAKVLHFFKFMMHHLVFNISLLLSTLHKRVFLRHLRIRLLWKHSQFLP